MQVPSTARIVIGDSDVDWTFERYAGEAGKIDEHIAKQLKKIEDDRYLIDKQFAKKAHRIGTVSEGRIAGQKLVFANDDSIWYKIFAYTPVGSDLFVLTAHSNIEGEGNDDDRKDHRTFSEKLKQLEELSKQLRLMKDGEIPNEPGVCIEGAFIARTKTTYENIQLGVRLAEFQDVHFSIDSRKNQQYVNKSDELEVRLASAKKDAYAMGQGTWYNSIRVLRRQKRRINESDGAEILARKPKQPTEGESHQFNFYSIGVIDDPLRPKFDIQLDTGVHKNQKGTKPPSLTNEEAVALWDN